MKIAVKTVNAFVDQGRGGNPAGVVLDADSLSTSEKQKIASEIGLSETAFVSASNIAGFKLEFFTPTRQIAHCGHATIATFSYLFQLGRVKEGETSKETIDGVRKIVIRDGMAFMEQTAPRYEEITDKNLFRTAVQDGLGLSSGDLMDGCVPSIVNTGNSFLIVGVKTAGILKKIQPNLAEIEKVSEEKKVIGFYVFTRETSDSERHASTRMFAPLYGIPEESATGMAAGPLACFLFDKLGMRMNSLLIEQGHFMRPPSPSLITVELSLGSKGIMSLMAGGKAMPL